MNTIVGYIESLFKNIPLSVMEIWGRFGFLIGFFLMIFAYSGLTLRPGRKFSLGLMKQTWDAKSLVSVSITFIAICFNGYIGSFLILVPGAQTFESFKDLSVIICILIFGYPALFAIPFAYGISDLVEGIPPAFVLDWLPGYFINPACFWLASQFIGKDPDFRKKKTWLWYLLSAFIFIFIEPELWGYICSEHFTPEISYRYITPAIFFTTSITWLLVPLGMLALLPLAKRLGYFWAEIPGYVRERVVGSKEWIWVSGNKDLSSSKLGERKTVPIRVLLLSPFIFVVLVIVISTAYFTLTSTRLSSNQLAQRLQAEISENLKFRLDSGQQSVDQILNDLPHGKAFVVDHAGRMIHPLVDDPIIRGAVRGLGKHKKQGKLQLPVMFNFDVITPKPLSKESWLTFATPYKEQWILVTVLPESYYLAGVRKGNSQTAMIIAFALVMAFLIAGLLAALVTRPLNRLVDATADLMKGDYSKRLGASKLEEINLLTTSFNELSQQLQHSSEVIKNKENRIRIAIKAANLGIWEWNIVDNTLNWDDSMYELYGLPKKEHHIPLDVWSKSLIPEDLENVNEHAHASIRGEKNFETQFRVKWPDGSIHVIRSLGTTIKDSAGEPVQMIGVNYDVTEQKIAEQDLRNYRLHLEELVEVRTKDLLQKTKLLESSVKAKEELVSIINDKTEQLVEKERLATLGFISAGFAHEIKNPLNIICNGAEIIRKQLAKIDLAQITDEKTLLALSKLRESNEMISANGARVDNIVKTLLLQVKTSQDISPQAIDLKEVIRSNLDFVLSNYRPQINNRYRTLLELPDEQIRLLGNPSDIGRVFINVFDNCCYALVERINADPIFSGIIKVVMTLQGPMVHIMISDNGIGIPQDHLSQVFTPFFTTKAPGVGTGLGLNFANEIVKSHGGHIEIKSVVNEYTETHLFLPCEVS